MEVAGSPQQEAILPPADGALIPATIHDVGDIKKILQETSDFKWSQGDDLWGAEPFTDDEVAKMIESGSMFIYKVNGVAAASVLLPMSDERMWGKEQGEDGSAVYIHKLSAGDAFRGKGIGSKIMSHAENFARKNGKTKLRLDCPYDNLDLCKYYKSLGFNEVRRYDRPSSAGRRNLDKDNYKTALYEKELSSPV